MLGAKQIFGSSVNSSLRRKLRVTTLGFTACMLAGGFPQIAVAQVPTLAAPMTTTASADATNDATSAEHALPIVAPPVASAYCPECGPLHRIAEMYEPRAARPSTDDAIDDVNDDRASQAAQFLVEAMRRSRVSPLEGTLFGEFEGSDASLPTERESMLRIAGSLERERPLPDMMPHAGSLESSAATFHPSAVPDHTAAHVANLRQAANDLDQVANQLEEDASYEAADRIRAMADELRFEARYFMARRTDSPVE